MQTDTISRPNIAADIERGAAPEPSRNAASNNASRLGEVCLRKLYYYRTAGVNAEGRSIAAQGRMNTGRELEDLCRIIYNRLGLRASPPWRVTQQAVPINDKLMREYQIGLRPDWFLQIEYKGDWVTPGPVEVKTTNTRIFAALSDLESMKRFWWMRNYRAQLTIYELASNYATGFFLFINRDNFYEVTLIELPLDMEYAEGLLVKAKEVNEHIRAGLEPDKINDATECGRCCFASLCCPECLDTSKVGVEICSDQALIDALSYLREHREIADEIETQQKIRDKLLAAMKGRDIIAGDWLVTWRKQTRHYREQPAKPAHDEDILLKEIVDLTEKDG